MPISTANEFFTLLEKSRLLSPEQLAEARKLAASSNGEAGDATSIARTLARENMLTRWQAGQLLAGRSAFFLGKYKLIDLLGRGGMGSVFLGEHVMMNRRVAIKVLSKQIGKEPGSLERFLAEARAIAALDHPNIVHAYNVEQEGDRYYIVMEYVDGTDLQRVVEKEGPLDAARAGEYIRQAAEGLAHAHAEKIVHCDIKPSNLLVNSQDVVKILDMGLARLVGREQAPAEENGDSILGSVDYLAPEQAVASPDFDHRADIYSLGCTLYFLLTARPPFPEGTLPERIMKHQNEKAPSIAEQRSEVPADLVAICDRMMAKDPAERYQKAEEVGQAVAALRLNLRKPKRAAPLKRAEAIEEEKAAPAVVAVDTARKKTSPPAKRPGAVADKTVADKPVADKTVADKTEKAEPSGDEDASTAAVAGASFWATPKGKWALIGGGVAAVLLLVGVGVGVGMMFAGNNGGPVAQSPADAKPTPRTRAFDPDLLDLDSLDGPNRGKPASEAPKSPEPAATPEQPSDMPKDGENPPTEPVKTETPPSEPPAETPKPDPSKTEPEKPKEPPKTEKKDPPKPPPKADPFKDVAKHIDLPKPPKDAGETSAPVALGSVKLDGKPLAVQLLGGKEVVKGAYQFELADDPSAAGKAWLISEQAKGKDDRLQLARLTLDEDQLAWQWTAEAGQGHASQLRNCGLKLTSGTASHVVVLGKLSPVPPLVVDLDRAKPIPTSISLDPMPETEFLRLQITKLEGGFPKHKIEPGDTLTPPIKDKGKVDSSKSELQIVFTEKNLYPLVLHLTLHVPSNKCLLKLDPYYKAGELAPPMPLALTDLRNKMMMAQAAAKQFEALSKAKGANKQQLEAQSKAAKEAGDAFSGLIGLAQSIHKTGKIHYRLFVEVDGEQLELASTEVAGADMAPDTTPDDSPPPGMNIDDGGGTKRFFTGGDDEKKEPTKKK